MADLVPVQPGTLPLRGTTAAGHAPRVGRFRRRVIVARGRRAVAGGPLLPAWVATVATVATVRAAEHVARRLLGSRAPAPREAAGRPAAAPLPSTTLHLSWTYVELRWRR